jgi:acetyltransferase-like isoleucine patch superfamily enzyme
LSGRKQHSFSDPEKPIREQGGEFEKIHIGSDCWLGNQATVMVNLPDKVLVAAGSVVTRPANRGDILAGNPADVVRNRLDIDKC